MKWQVNMKLEDSFFKTLVKDCHEINSAVYLAAQYKDQAEKLAAQLVDKYPSCFNPVEKPTPDEVEDRLKIYLAEQIILEVEE
jgi:hypothetical protein